MSWRQNWRDNGTSCQRDAKGAAPAAQMRRRVNGLALAKPSWLGEGLGGRGWLMLELPPCHHRRDRVIAVGLADVHRRRGHDRGMLYFLRQVGANAPTITGTAMACFKDEG